MRTKKNNFTIPPTVADQVDIICEGLGVSFEDLIKKDRNKPLPDGRKILVYLIRLHAPAWATSPNLATLVDRDHSSVLIMLGKTVALMETERSFRQQIERISNNIDIYKNNNSTKMEKTVNDNLNDMVKNHVITEGFKTFLLKGINKEKTEAIEELREEIRELKDECNQQA